MPSRQIARWPRTPRIEPAQVLTEPGPPRVPAQERHHRALDDHPEAHRGQPTLERLKSGPNLHHLRQGCRGEGARGAAVTGPGDREPGLRSPAPDLAREVRRRPRPGRQIDAGTRGQRHAGRL
jgi:hypothetical protein